jgi:hypothetical protein
MVWCVKLLRSLKSGGVFWSLRLLKKKPRLGLPGIFEGSAPGVRLILSNVYAGVKPTFATILLLAPLLPQRVEHMQDRLDIEKELEIRFGMMQ